MLPFDKVLREKRGNKAWQIKCETKKTDGKEQTCKEDESAFCVAILVINAVTAPPSTALKICSGS